MIQRLPIYPTVAIAFAIVLSSSIDGAAESGRKDENPVVTRVYKVSHLTTSVEEGPYSQLKQLMERLKSKTGDDDETTFAPYPQNLSLVISTTERKHDIIAKALEQEEKRIKRASPAKKTTTITTVYEVGDLAAFTAGKSSWDPIILLELLKAKTGDDDSITFAPYPQNLSIIISATSEQHKTIRDTLRKVRRKK